MFPFSLGLLERMNRKEWMLLFCLFAIYLLLGACFFYLIESREEEHKLKEQKEEREDIQRLLLKHYNGSDAKFLKRLSEYCGKPISLNMGELRDQEKWDYYHSLFFVITVVSTIGYGNLAPTTMLTRIIMIFYGLIGISMNGIVIVSLGGFFARTFTKLYKRWKTSNMQADATRLGLISQIFLYAIPGLIFFIFLPSLIIVIFEGWDYDVAVYFAFVTLTTIGFGDYVAGVTNTYHHSHVTYGLYQAFLIVWVIGGLGYVVMVIHFITKGMTSKKVIKFERAMREAPYKLMRSLLNEFILTKVKPVYKDQMFFEPQIIERSQSCPDIRLYESDDSLYKVRQRAFSVGFGELLKGSSDTNLSKIDKERTFRPSDALRQQKDLLIRFMDAISYKSEHSEPEYGVNLFSDSQILASEQYGSQTSLSNRRQRRRAVSDIRPPAQFIADYDHEAGHTWYGDDAKIKSTQFRDRTLSMPYVQVPKCRKNSRIIQRLKDVFRTGDSKTVDVEKQPEEDQSKSIGRYSLFDVPEGEMQPKPSAEAERQSYLQKTNRGRMSMFAHSPTPQENYIRQTRRGRHSMLAQQHDSILEQTSVADFLRALDAMGNSEPPRRKLGTVTPPETNTPNRLRRQPIQPILQHRRASVIPTHATNEVVKRRFSLRPVEETSPPSYSMATSEIRKSLRGKPRKISRPDKGPVQRQLIIKREREDSTSDKQ